LKEFIRCQFLIISFLITVKVEAQREGNIWCFGDSALIDWNDTQNPILGRSVTKNRGSATSIADSTGSLLFYVGNISAALETPEWQYCRDTLVSFEVGHVYTKYNNYMENGRCITGGGWYEEYTIVPMPGNDSLYYIFSVNLYAYDGNSPGINYSTVDMHANGGLGKVIERDVGVVSYTPGGLGPIYWFIKAVRHGNGRDWWVIAKTTPFNQDIGSDLMYLLLLVTPDGITVEEIPPNEPYCPTGFSSSGFSNDGTKFYSICAVNPIGNVVVYDFDRCTGELTNAKIIEEAISDSIEYSIGFWSAEFSPNSRYLYVNTSSFVCASGLDYYLFQYDLEEDFPAETRDTLLSYTVWNTEIYKGAGTLKLAPDNKIYYARPVVSCNYYWWPYPDSLYLPQNENLSVINNPDSTYPACNFTPYSFYLGGARTYYGLPNNPNFALGAVEGSECDTLSTSVGEVVSYINNQLNIFPNPCYNNCQIQYKPAKSIGNMRPLQNSVKLF
jgi:hypothetical protein